MAGYTDTVRLLDGAALRATALAFRGDPERFDPPDDPDPALVDPVERPFESVGDVAERLADLEARLRERDDRRAVFLTIYVRMTRAVADGIEGGLFADPAWMRRYLVTFADYYRRAFLAFERGRVGAVPDPWRVAFGSALRGDALVAQDAFLGVNAHINYDLALAIDDVGVDPDRARKYADHRRIDDILTRIVDAQQETLAELYAAGIDDVDAALGRFDESLTLLSMTEGREAAWHTAVVLNDVGATPVAAAVRWLSRTVATGGAFFVLGPRFDPALWRALRRVEADGVDLDALAEGVRKRVEAGDEE